MRTACGSLQGNFPMKAMLSIMKFRGRGTWPSPSSPTNLKTTTRWFLNYKLLQMRITYKHVAESISNFSASTTVVNLTLGLLFEGYEIVATMSCPSIAVLTSA